MVTSTKQCPYCSKEILETAIKCKHCCEWLDKSARLTQSQNYTSSNLTTSVKLALANKYELLEKVGEGGMAVFYKARQINLDRIVALKVIHQNLVYDKEFLDRFHREARIAASLNNPNIVTIYDEGNEKGVHFIAMEYLEGIDLHSLIKQEGRLTEEETIRIAISISEALDYAHKKGIIHRDVKSSNIIITQEGRIVLTDFGIARAVSGTKSSLSGSVIGTPEYMSPEQAEGKQIDGRSDLFSLGVVLYECLIGSPPFKADNPLTTIYQIINSNPKPVVDFRSDVSDWLNSCIKKVLNKNPRARFQTGNEFRNALVNKMFYDISERKSSEQKNFNLSATPVKPTVKITNTNIRQKKKGSSITFIFSVLISLIMIIIFLMISKSSPDSNKDSSIFTYNNTITENEKNKVGEGNLELNGLLIEARTLLSNLFSLSEADRLVNLAIEIKQYAPQNSFTEDYFLQVKNWLDKSIEIAISNRSWSYAIELLKYASEKFGGPEYDTRINEVRRMQKQIEQQQVITNLIQKAGKYIQNFRWDDALTTFEEILKTEPANRNAQNGRTRVIEAIISRGDELFNNRNYYQAYQLYQKALTLRPGDTRIQIKLTKAEEKTK